MLLILLGACAEPGEARGAVENALGGPLPSGLVLAATSPGAPGGCARVEAPVDDDGDFALAGLCAGHEYRLQPTDPTWWAADAPAVRGGQAVTGVKLPLWHAPTEDGVFLLRGATLERVVSQTAIDAVTELSTGRPLRVPAAIPAVLPSPAGGWLVLAGGEAAALTAAPLVPTEPVVVGPADAPRALGPWFALGDGRPLTGTDARGPAPPATEPTLSAGEGGRLVRYVPPDALPAGDWALVGGGGARAILVRFGSTP